MSNHYANKMTLIQNHFENQRYIECVNNCRILLEKAHKELYSRLLLDLNPEQSAEIRDQEKKFGTGHYNKLGLGQLYGLFRKANVYDKLTEILKIEGKALKKIDLKDSIELANNTQHESYQPHQYEAEEIKVETRKFLNAAKFLSESEKELYDRNDVYRFLCQFAMLYTPLPPQHKAFLNQKADEIKLSHGEKEAIEKEFNFKSLIPTAPVNPPRPVPPRPNSLTIHTTTTAKISLAEQRLLLRDKYLTPEVFEHPKLKHLDWQKQRTLFDRLTQFKLWANYLAGLYLTLHNKEDFRESDVIEVLNNHLLPQHFDQPGAKKSGLLTADLELHSNHHQGFPCLKKIDRGVYTFVGLAENPDT